MTKEITLTETIQQMDVWIGDIQFDLQQDWNEEKPLMFSGGYYLSDGNPIKDHPYSGTFAFHIRGERHYIRPKAGMLMMWPHDLLHSVAPFYGETYRTVINFNIEV